jgi:hypothetical protein
MRLMEDLDANALREIEKVLLDNGYSEKVKDAIIEWYSRH